MLVSMAGLFIAAAALQGAAAWADVVILKTNVKIHGIARKTDDGSVEVQTDSTGYVSYPMTEVLKIQTATAEENAALMEKWRKADEAAHVQEKADDNSGEVPAETPNQKRGADHE